MVGVAIDRIVSSIRAFSSSKLMLLLERCENAIRYEYVSTVSLMNAELGLSHRSEGEGAKRAIIGESGE